jgi:hypothetical protein
MFRLKIILVNLCITVAGVLIALLTVGDRRDSQEQSIRENVQKSETKYVQIDLLRRLALKDGAKWLAEQSELRAYMIELSARRDGLLENLQWAYAKVDAGSDDVSIERREAALLKEQNVWLTDFATSLADRIERIRGMEAWGGEGAQTREQFIDKTKKDLARCNAHSVAKCFYEFTYRSLFDVAKRVNAHTASFGLTPTLLVAADDRLVGIADARNPAYSKDGGLKDRFRLLNAVKQGQVVVDALVSDNTDSVRFLCGAPILDAGEFRGAVLLGVEVDAAVEKDLVGYDVSYFRDADLLRTTLLGEQIERIKSTQVPRLTGRDSKNAAQVFELTGDSLAGLFIPITQTYSNTSLQVLLSVDISEVLSDLDVQAALIPVYGLLIFIVGTLLLLFVIRLHLQPFEKLELGIREVINGNTEYEFPYNYSETMWNSLAQELNLMVGVLLGRQVLDEAEFDDWAQKYLEDERKARESEESEEDEEEEEGDDAAESAPAEAMAEGRKPTIDTQAVAELPVADSALANEPPEDYYRRIFAEFSKLRRDGDEPITYVKFVEKVVRQERMLRHQHKCRMVRFNIAKGSDGPVFVPVRID